MDGLGLEGGLGVRRGCHLIGLGLGCGARLADSGGMRGRVGERGFFLQGLVSQEERFTVRNLKAAGGAGQVG